MTDELKVRPLAAAEAGARQFLMMAGMGFLGLVVGAFLTSSLIARLNDRFDGEQSDAVQWVLGLLLPNLWALVVIPGLGWLCLRFLELNPLSFAVVSCGTAFVFRLALDFVSGGAEMILSDPRQLTLQLVVLGVGIGLTWLAGRRGQVYAQAEAVVAAAQAQKARQQYSQFAEQAKAMAERREAQPISAPAVDPTASTGPSATTAAPEVPPVDPTAKS